MLHPATCSTMEIAPNEKEIGRCGRSLYNGVCPVHGHFSHAPNRSMVELEEVLSEPEHESKKLALLYTGLVLMFLGFMGGFLFNFAFFILAAVGLQLWLTVLCWMK